EDRGFARTRLAEGAIDADQVAEVEELRELPAGRANLPLADHHLDPARPVEVFGRLVLASDRGARGGVARPVPEVEEVELPLDAPADDAPGRAHLRALVVGQVARQREDLLDRLMVVEPAAPGVDSQSRDLSELVGTTRFVLTFRCGGHVVFDF